jgi:CHAT domain-containing protein
MGIITWCTPLGQSLPLVVLPALGVLPRLQRRPHVRIGPALVVGNPTGNLPFAKEEANTVTSLFGTSPLLGSEATKAAVLDHLEQALLIHLATHAFFDPNAPLEAGIILADGVLTAREVLEYRLHADLLVLSSCESGQASTLGGEELAGLSQAFFQAGARSLLVSLWRVSDSATAALMRAFYSERLAGADKAQALRQAMTQVQQDPRWTHPYYWGAFVLIGDWD